MAVTESNEKAGAVQPSPTAEAVRDTVRVTVEPASEYGANVFSVQIKINKREPGGSLVRTSPREFAFQVIPDTTGK